MPDLIETEPLLPRNHEVTIDLGIEGSGQSATDTAKMLLLSLLVCK